MDIIYIKWFDAYYDDEVCEIEKIHNKSPFILETIGMYVDSGKDYICIATEKMPSGEYKYRHYIPKINIIKKIVFKCGDLKEGKEKDYLVIPISDPPDKWVATTWDVRENIKLCWKRVFKAYRRKK